VSNEWVVSIKSTVTTHHRVRVTEKDYRTFGWGTTPRRTTPRELPVSFGERAEYLNSSSFDLRVIGHYFPEYEREIQARLQRAH